MNCQTVVFLKIYWSLLICKQFCLGYSGEWFLYHQIRDSREKIEDLIRYVYHNYKEDYYRFENCNLFYVHVDGSALDEVVSLV